MNLDDLLASIRHEAQRLHSDAGLPLGYAWERAIISVIREEAERPDISELQERILRALEILSPTPKHGPVYKSQLISKVPGLDSDWQAWYHLDVLRNAGKVRLIGKRWKAVSTIQDIEANAQTA